MDKHELLDRVENLSRQAKRVKREASIVVQQSARLRDALQSEEDTRKHEHRNSREED